MTEEKMAAMDGKVLCGDVNGGAVLMTGIDVIERQVLSENRVKPVLQISGTARAYLISPQNPAQGAELLESPMAVSIEIDVERDFHVGLKILGQCLYLGGDDALVADESGDWLDRFSADGANSVVPLLREKGLYIKLSKKASTEKALKYGESPFYFNPFYVPVRNEATKIAIASLKEAFKKKAAASNLAGILT